MKWIVTIHSVFDSTTWPQIQERLCPQNRPNIALGGKLFKLAAKELGISAPEKSSLWHTYFSGKFETAQECYLIPSTQSQICYIPIWKCANREIRLYLDTILEKRSNKRINKQSSSFVFTVIRDPVEHFLSGYNEIERRAHNDTKMMGRHSFYGKPLASEERFTHFLMDFLQMRRSPYWMWAHIYSMSRVLSTKKPTYLTSTENLTYTLPLFLKKECKGFDQLADNQTATMIGGGLTKKNRLAGDDPLGTYNISKIVWKRQGPISRTLCLINAMDYACWKDLPMIPHICQVVFTADSFVDTFLPSAQKGNFTS